MMVALPNPRRFAMRPDLLIRTLLTLTLLAAGGAGHAADKPKKESGFGAGKGAYLTRDELRVCLGRQANVSQQDGEMLKEQATLTAAKAEIARSGDSLKERLDGLDRTNLDAVTAYNDAAEARDKQIDAYQVRVTEFNTRVDALKVEREAFGKGCDNRRYFEDDEIAIKKGK